MNLLLTQATIQAFQRDLFHPKTRIATFNHEVTANYLARYLRPLATRYLGVKGVIIVLDNTDQFSPVLQDYCFTLAQSISTQLDCLVIISMREERFHFSKLHGTLDAFPNSGFHLSSPPPHDVFDKRLKYLLYLLNAPDSIRRISPDLTNAVIDDLKNLIIVLLKDFNWSNSRLNAFLQATAHGNMRIALEMFTEFLLSGYTQVHEMIQRGGWTLATHQVVRPMMVPYRFFYDEARSKVPNIYQVRSPSVFPATRT